MRGLYAIYRKEMGNYFVSPIAYVVVGVFLILCGFFFDRILSYFIENSQSDVPSAVMRSFFDLFSSLVLFLTPMLTMGVYSEERKRGTMELLMTSPVTETQIVLGKFLASLSLLAIMLLPTASYLAYMNFHSDPVMPWRLLWAGYLGMLLFGG